HAGVLLVLFHQRTTPSCAGHALSGGLRGCATRNLVGRAPGVALSVDRVLPLCRARNSLPPAVARSRCAWPGPVVPVHLGGGHSVVLHARDRFAPRVLRIWSLASGCSADRCRPGPRRGASRRVVASAADESGGGWSPRRRRPRCAGLGLTQYRR